MSTYVFDTTHTNIGFVVRHAMITKVHGSFTDFDASFDPDAQTATATIKVNSLDTKNKDRDAHVLSGDFFDAENFPTMTFTATSTTLTSSNQGTVTGNTRLGVEATTTINRKDFGIDFNAPLNTGGVLLSEDIKIIIDGSAIKQ